MSNEPVVDATTGKASPAASDPAKVEPVKPAPDPLSMKLDGEQIPEKFRGKTAAEILAAYGELEGALTDKSKLVSDWEKWYMKNHPTEADPGNGGAGGSGNPELPFDQKQIDLLGSMLNKALQPMQQALDNVFLENIKAVVPDFASHEKRAREIYDSMPAQFKYSPKHGWVFAYNMAKSEATGIPKAAAPPPISGSGPSPAPGKEPDLTEEELNWAKKQNMTAEEYKKFQTPLENQ